MIRFTCSIFLLMAAHVAVMGEAAAFSQAESVVSATPIQREPESPDSSTFIEEKDTPHLEVDNSLEFPFSIPTIPGFDKVTDIWESVKCKGITDCEECKHKKCHFCSGGSVARSILQFTKIIPLPKGLMGLSDSEIETGNFCGVYEAKCTEFASYWNMIPSMARNLLPSFEGPQFDPCGPPDHSAPRVAGYTIMGVTAFVIFASSF